VGLSVAETSRVGHEAVLNQPKLGRQAHRSSAGQAQGETLINNNHNATGKDQSILRKMNHQEHRQALFHQDRQISR
jgi:hypothetical protein